VPDALRRRGGLFLRLLVSVLLLGAVLAYADVDDVARAVREGDWGWFVAALAVMAVAAVVGAVRWRLLLEGARIEVSASRSIRVFSASLFLNNVLPTSFGGDAVRAWLVGRESGRLLRATAATAADKLTALACLFLVAWGALIVDPEAVPRSLVGVLAWVTLGLAAAFVAVGLAAAGVWPVLRRRGLPNRLVALTRDALATLRVWARSAKLIGWLVGLGLAYQALAVVALVMIGKTVRIDLSFPLAAVCASIVLVAMLVPISIGGLGVREGGFVLLLAEAGVDGADATLLSLLSAAAILLASAGVITASAAYDALRTRQTRTRPVPRRRSA
jgi:glycosyltransferase 2 family protein